jgi:hypothetical protein
MLIRKGALAIVLLLLGSPSAFAQIRFVEYSAKFLCGVVDNQEPGSAAVRPGTYETSINIHNPQLPITPLPKVTLVKKAVLALREGERPIPPSAFRVDALTADFAMQVDCKVIRSLLGQAASASFIEGFLVLIVIPPGLRQPPQELDVIGVYTVDTPQRDISLEVIPIAPRFLTVPGPTGARLREELLKQSRPD